MRAPMRETRWAAVVTVAAMVVVMAVAATMTALLLTIVACGDGGGGASAATPVASPTPDRETVYQTSTLSALIDGLYQPATTVGAIKAQGDTGLGTYAALDGEMVVLDGVVYQVKSDGSVVKPPDTTGSPFAAVTTFDTDASFAIESAASYEALQKQIDAHLAGLNDIYAVRVEGHFDYVKTRSVPRQTEPYKPLLAVTATQPEFEFHDADGVLVGFWCPAWVGQIDPAGYHLHFLTADRSGGGHLLEVRVGEATVRLDDTANLSLRLPTTPEFQAIDLAGDYEEQMQAAEK
jgi:acetolactate decarboxylase